MKLFPIVGFNVWKNGWRERAMEREVTRLCSRVRELISSKQTPSSMALDLLPANFNPHGNS